MNFLVCPDSFKHCAPSTEVASIISQGIKSDGHNVECIPIADGGEGTVDCLLWSLGGEKVYFDVRGPHGKLVNAYFGINKNTAFIEMAQAAGIQYVSEEEKNPWITTSYGVGELISRALDNNVEKIIMGIGGSATSDCGIGMAQALGAKFFDNNENEIDFQKSNGYGGGCLERVKKIDMTNFDNRVYDTNIIVLSDVQNPLLGKNGACYTYGPQKGADEDMVKKLESGMENFAAILEETFTHSPNFPGAGGAGGLGAGLKLFCKAHIESGIDFLVHHLQLEEKIKKSDIVIVGEGQMDGQTPFGKAPSGIAKLAKKHNKKVYAIVGSVGDGYEKCFDFLDGILSCSDVNEELSLKDVHKYGKERLVNLVENFTDICKDLENNTLVVVR